MSHRTSVGGRGQCGFVTSVPAGRASTRHRQTRYSLSGRESRFLRACRPRGPCAARVSRRSWRCRLGDPSWPSSRSLRSGGHHHAWSPGDARAVLPPGATAAERARACGTTPPPAPGVVATCALDVGRGAAAVAAGVA
eukprot:ctg_2058.g519